MLIESSEQQMAGGPLDFICIFKSMQSGRYHPAFVEEKPLPGPVASVEDTTLVRMKSKMHHTGGFDTFEDAVKSATDDLRPKLVLPDENVALERPIPWDEEQMAFTLMMPNWTTCGKTLDELLVTFAGAKNGTD